MTGLSALTEDEFVLPAFTCAQVFRSSCAVLVLVRVIGGKCAIGQIIKSIKQGKLAGS